MAESRSAIFSFCPVRGPTTTEENWVRLTWVAPGGSLYGFLGTPMAERPAILNPEHPEDTTLELSRIFVDPKLRKAGTMRRLFDAAEAWADAHAVTCEVWPSCEHVAWLVPWLERRGYRLTAEGMWAREPQRA